MPHNVQDKTAYEFRAKKNSKAADQKPAPSKSAPAAKKE